MGKVKDEAAEARSSKPAPKAGKPGRRANRFWATLFGSGLYKPMQGWHARLWTGIGAASLLLVGVWRLFDTLDGLAIPVRYGLAGTLAAAFAWLSFRIVHYPPFADFLIATQAEMNKVSWISRDDLKKATAVVLITVLMISLFLFGIDQLWMTLLRWIGVLNVTAGTGEAMGSAG
ncbi:preprotein translocase subunit SecE [Tautonia plasticadhaerens]|uniref:Protein translocase subunit SecE n=1 Tax=Tautonia plasticadhaerens TaxID=2527974 RepID=A0A518GUL1_9BACT|nr:preprotein translocase subunit SecE [Tautonia plasticadhaerens]QDV32273.1 preprotein translocase subunit SecE [Tautonia plasticadhaerens]